MNTVNEVSELADWLGNHAQHLERMEEIGAMPESELTPQIVRAAELLRQLAPAPADKVPAIPCCEPEQATMAAARAAEASAAEARAVDAMEASVWNAAKAAARIAATAIKLQQLAPQNPLGVTDPTIARAAELLRQLAPASAPAAAREAAARAEARAAEAMAVREAARAAKVRVQVAARAAAARAEEARAEADARAAEAPSAAAAVEAQQARQDLLEELYDQGGRHEPSHPMHGLYTGLVQHTPTTPKGDFMSEFVVFSLPKQPIAIRKSSVNAFFPASHGDGTVIEYTSESAIVKELFDEVCAIMGVSAPQQEQT